LLSCPPIFAFEAVFVAKPNANSKWHPSSYSGLGTYASMLSEVLRRAALFHVEQFDRAI
jgi:hypothetical protein